MILLDTNVLINAFDPGSPCCEWARDTIADAVAVDGAAIHAVSLPKYAWGIETLTCRSLTFSFFPKVSLTTPR